MRAQTIAQLAWYKPRSNNVARLSTCVDLRGITRERAADIIHYAECHKNLQFGWDFAVALSQSPLPFPALLHGDDLFVWRAYNYLLGRADAAVEGAVALNMDSMTNTRNQVRALLIANNVDYKFVAHNLNLPLDMVKAYEKLFFNVLDRKKDHAFIADVVFPNGRMVEAFENYLETTGIGDLMLRAGYTHGRQHVLYGAGLGKNPYTTKDAMEGAKELDNMFMADGCLYASLGWMHQTRNAMPITNARLSMQASKMGNNNIDKSAGLISLGDTMKTELVRMGQLKAEAASKALALTQVVPVIPRNDGSDTDN